MAGFTKEKYLKLLLRPQKQKLKIKDIKTIPPQSFGFPYNGKGNAINLLKDIT